MRNKVSKNFYQDEYACKDNCGFDEISPYTVDVVQQIRDEIGQAITISSGCRCAKHNKAVGGVANSQHVKGTAADLHTDLPPKELFEIIKKMYADGRIKSLGYCQLYDWGCHVDVRHPKAHNIFNG